MDRKVKWNKKYKERIKNNEAVAVNKRLKDIAFYLKGGTALDLACGLGGNSLFLAELGYNVHAIDLSDVAIDNLKENATKHQYNIHASVADLTDWTCLPVKEIQFDLVVMTYYLDRALFPAVKAAIKKGGYFFMETFFVSPLNVKPEMPSHFKLQSNELLSEFSGWKVLFYEENEQEGRQTLFCQKR